MKFATYQLVDRSYVDRESRIDRHPSAQEMHPVTEDSLKADEKDEIVRSTKDRTRDVEKAALTRTTARRRDGNRVLSSRARSELIVRANQDHQGSVSCASFYLFFSGTFLFTMAGTLLSTGAWCFLVRLPMIHLAHEPSRIIVVLSGYIFAAGALTLPASCILYREHNVTSTRRTLLPMMIMLCSSVLFLICGATHGIAYRKSHQPVFQERTTAQQDNGLLISRRREHAAPSSGTLRGRINAALTSRLRDYPNYSSAWDLVQHRRKRQDARVEYGLCRRDSVGSGMDHGVRRGTVLHVDPGTRPGHRIGRSTFLDLRRASTSDG